MNPQPNDSHPTYREDDEISLAELWAALRARVRLIVGVTLLSATVAAAIALVMTPIYRAEVVLAVVDDSSKSGGLSGLASQFGGLASLAGVSLGGSSDRGESIGTLSSRQLIEGYISSHNLLPVLFYKKWDENSKDWQPGLSKIPTLWDGTQQFIKDVRAINEDKKSGLITLAVEWKDAATAATWANDLVRLANQIMRERAIKNSEANLAYLNAQLEQTSVVELRQAIYRLIESEVKNVMVAQGSSEYAFKVIDPAVTPEKKARPLRLLIVMVGLFVGLMLSSIYALATSSSQRGQS